MSAEYDLYQRQLADGYRFNVREVVAVAEEDEPITLEEARAHLRVDTYESGSPPATVSDDDDWITAMLPAARAYCEQYMGRALAPRTMELAAAAFPSVAPVTPPGAAFVLPMGPAQSIESIKYYDADGVEQTVDAATYDLDVFGAANVLQLAYGQTWPTPRTTDGRVRVRYVTGHGAPADSPALHPLPRLARSAILLMLGHLYENREAATAATVTEIPLGVRALLDLLPYRDRLGFV